MERIEALRQEVLKDRTHTEEFFYYFFQKYFQLPDISEEERYAQSFYYAMECLPPHISEGELVVGKCLALPEDKNTEWETELGPKALERKAINGGGQHSHMSIDYSVVLHLGINGLIARIDEYLATCEESKIPFYRCCKRCLEAVLLLSDKYAEAALALSETAAPKRKAELLEIARICKKVPAQAPDTFYEAVQAINFVTYCVSFNPFKLCDQIFMLDHIDRILLPFYEKDRKEGILTKEFAQLLLDCMGIAINTRVCKGVACGYMVGGTDENGKVIDNELTRMGLQVIDDIRLVYPSVGLCYAEGISDETLTLACSLLAKGRTHPAIFGDEVIIKGLKSYGVPHKLAHNYIHSACVEITPVGASNAWVASPYTNMPQLLLDIMDREYASFDDLLSAYFAHLDQRIKKNWEAENLARKTRGEHSMIPLLSCFVNDCLERGLDIEKGGAIYNWIMPSFIGVANVVDALYAIKTLVFEEKKLTISEYKNIVDHNFEGNEALRQYILNRIDKYGNDIDEIDNYVSLITKHLVAECEKYQCLFSNGQLIPSLFCWENHERFGRATTATPDGRPAGFPLGDGSGPCQGREMNGPTASILSSTKWDHSRFIGGVAVNLKFSKQALGANSVETIKNLVKTYIARGGFEVQINVIDNETLRKAQQNPDEYKDLLVRIGGYSDYFVRIPQPMQEEVILRTSHHV